MMAAHRIEQGNSNYGTSASRAVSPAVQAHSPHTIYLDLVHPSTQVDAAAKACRQLQASPENCSRAPTPRICNFEDVISQSTFACIPNDRRRTPRRTCTYSSSPAIVPRTPTPTSPAEATVPLFECPREPQLRPSYGLELDAPPVSRPRVPNRRPRRCDLTAGSSVPALSLPPVASVGKRPAPFVDESAARLLELDLDASGVAPRAPACSLLHLARASHHVCE
eukprot:tig00000319_g24133.t1